MEKSKKFRMPAGIRNKLTAAVAMLLVSSIMMVSSTYAWFTLSTAPEVTGITTSVGANGNLEMALLTTDTFGNLTAIGSAVGDSSAVKDVKLSNVTWGNLVDLSAAAYGLNTIALMPAALNGVYTGEGEDRVLTGVNPTNPLLTAVYGADGRVSTVDGTTVSAVADENGAFAYGDTQSYGVRAIGVTSNLSVREIALKNAKSAVTSAANSAKAGTTSAINNNMGALLVFASATEAPASYSDSEIAAFYAIASGVVTDLATLGNGYKNAAIAYAAANATDDAAFALAKTAIDGMTLSDLATNAETYGIGSLAEAMNDLIDAQNAAAEAKAFLAEATPATSGADIKTEVQKLVDGIDKSTEGSVVVYIGGGAIGELGAQLGTFELASVGGMGTVYAGANTDADGTYTNAVNLVEPLSISDAGTDVSNITDTYGYIIDFAFRTNAAQSNLQLQTSAVNRVYTDQTGADLATQGSGSTVTYVYHPDMTVEQVNKMLGAIRLLFVDTANGTIYKTAVLTDIDVADGEATANVKLEGQTGDVGTIVALDQNVAKAISVLVYLDGNVIDNTAVPNAATSGMLNLNLQFSSSAELIPMQNTALEQMTAYTVSFNANGGFGYMADVRASGDYTVTANRFTAPTGKVFKGWAKTATITADTDLVTTLTLEENVTLYAIWEDDPNAGVQEPETQTYTVSFNANYPEGATFADDANAVKTMADTSVDTETYNLPANSFTAPDGYEFGGWIVNGTGEAQAVGTPITVEANIALTAVWNTAG